MKQSKKTQRVLTHLDKIEDIIKYYTNGSNMLGTEFIEIKKLIEELSIERKVDHARFAKKLKWFWEKSQETDGEE
jgi:hypothetical protein